MLFDYVFDHSYDSTRLCYGRARLLRDAAMRAPVIDAVMTTLQVPLNSSERRRLSVQEKTKALEEHIAHLARLRSSEWKGCGSEEIFAAGFYLSKTSAAEKAKVFHPVNKEEELRKPVRKWLKQADLKPFDEVPMGQSRVDVLGFKPEGFFNADRVVAVELKNHLSQLKRGLDQMTNYTDYAHQVYLACTPDLAAKYLRSHFNAKEVGRWDPRALERKLDKFGFGLLLIEKGRVFEVRSSEEFSPDEQRLRELRGAIMA